MSESESMHPEIIEHEDRWILLPLRGGRVVGVDWRPEEVGLLLDTDFLIVIGYDAELSPQSVAKDAIGRHQIGHWRRDEVENALKSEILSPVFFKSGGARVAFRNGWKLFLPECPATSPAAVVAGSQGHWISCTTTSETLIFMSALGIWMRKS
ncbi:hypothetical protein ACWDSJ_06130 [Nocardia sp. NPDC003482]